MSATTLIMLKAWMKRCASLPNAAIETDRAHMHVHHLRLI